jgi:chromate reductase
MVFVEALPLAKPEVMVTLADTRFDASGVLVDAATRQIVASQLATLSHWVERLRQPAGTAGTCRLVAAIS